MLKVTDLHAGYGLKRVLQAVNLQVRPGEIVAILGNNGAGKSTLLNALCGVISPMAGAVEFLGRDITGLTPSQIVPAGISYAPQGAQIFRTLTVIDNLMMGGFSVPDQEVLPGRIERIWRLFPALQVRRDVRAGSLSGGERQMLATGMLLMTAPRLVVLDEPSGGLSPLFVDRVYDAISGIRDTLGASVVVVEQDLSHALDIADRLYVLCSGRVVLEMDKARFGDREAIERAIMGF